MNLRENLDPGFEKGKGKGDGVIEVIVGDRIGEQNCTVLLNKPDAIGKSVTTVSTVGYFS